jgi:hypothetical protein
MKKKNLKDENIVRFAEAGFRICKLGHRDHGEGSTDFDLPGKIPGSGFTKVKFNPSPDVRNYPRNYGVVLDNKHLIVDVDPRNFPEGRDSLKELEADLCINIRKACGFYVITGGGGFHYYFKKPPKILIKNALKEYEGVEFKGLGRQVVGPGSIHPETCQPYVLVGNPMDLFDAPGELVELIRREDIRLEKGTGDYDDSEANRILTRQALDAHPPAVEGQRGNDTTYQAACICRENGVSKDLALELLEEYNERCEPPWMLDELVAIVNNAYRYGQNAIGSKNIKGDFEAVEDEEPEIAAKKEPVVAPVFLDEIKEHWCYSISTKRFFDLRDMAMLDKEMFDDTYAGATDKKKPSAFAIQCPDMRKVFAPTYWPGRPQFIAEKGRERLNLYKDPGLVPAPGDVKPFMDFVDLLLGNKAWIIHDYFAYLLQNPGEKALWAPLIQGKPGVGKSLMARILMTLFGDNVSQPTNDQLHEKYTDWLKACQLVVIHELMAGGRLEMMNRLKDPITEPTIRVREMWSPPYEIVNRANFLFLTNHEDAIILPKDDRRFAIIFSDAAIQEPAYYYSVVDWWKGNGPAALLHYYLHEHIFDVRFDAKAPAPVTAEKLQMIENTRHPVEATIMDMLDDERPPFHGKLALSTQIFDTISAIHRGVSNAQLSMYLRSCGFEKVTGRSRLRGSDGLRGVLWAIRDTGEMKKLSEGQLRTRFIRQEEDYENNVLERDFNEQGSASANSRSKVTRLGDHTYKQRSRKI